MGQEVRQGIAGDSLSLLHDVWGFSWDGSKLRGSNQLKIHLFASLARDACLGSEGWCARAARLLRHLTVFFWSLYRPLCLGLCVEREQHVQAVIFFF